ncbi:MAG: 4-hydroxy-3-methylbut-2-enyl diphosphate reductase [Dehalococcoidia bacterium]|nr:4-hydroxy-3-methylbut-2-enyl diphosphate reductase [Dehalococcoidia bacterium]
MVRIILANPRGFCAGVNMAIETLDQALHLFGAPVYVYHEIVHNKHVVERFRAKGAIFVDSLGEVPAGATVVFSAHGVSPEIRRAAADRDLRVIDATCPLVTKVHTEAVRFARQGRTILLIGHEGHDEITGTMGEAPERMRLVQSVDEAATLGLDDEDHLAFLTQTTLSVDDANQIIERLRDRFPAVAAPPSEDICYATQNRQEAVRQLAREADVVLVLGSQNSSNSRRLAEIAGEMGVPAHLIDCASEIEPGWLAGVERVAITAGASAPEELVAECVAYLEARYGASVEDRRTRTEDMHFQLPVELRRALAARQHPAEPPVAPEPV